MMIVCNVSYSSIAVLFFLSIPVQPVGKNLEIERVAAEERNCRNNNHHTSTNGGHLNTNSNPALDPVSSEKASDIEFNNELFSTTHDGYERKQHYGENMLFPSSQVGQHYQSSNNRSCISKISLIKANLKHLFEKLKRQSTKEEEEYSDIKYLLCHNNSKNVHYILTVEPKQMNDIITIRNSSSSKYELVRDLLVASGLASSIENIAHHTHSSLRREKDCCR